MPELDKSRPLPVCARPNVTPPSGDEIDGSTATALPLRESAAAHARRTAVTPRDAVQWRLYRTVTEAEESEIDRVESRSESQQRDRTQVRRATSVTGRCCDALMRTTRDAGSDAGSRRDGHVTKPPPATSDDSLRRKARNVPWTYSTTELLDRYRIQSSRKSRTTETVRSHLVRKHYICKCVRGILLTSSWCYTKLQLAAAAA